MAIVLDQVGRLLRTGSRNRTICIVCRRPVLENDRRMVVRGSVHVHQGCASYRMRHVESGRARLGYPPR